MQMSPGLPLGAGESERATLLMYGGLCAFCVLGVLEWIIVHMPVCVCVHVLLLELLWKKKSGNYISIRK